MKSRKQVILGKLTTKLVEPSITAKKFFEEAQELFESCLLAYDKKNFEIFLPLFKPYEQSHGIKLLRMSKRPLGLFFEVDDSVYHIAITDKDYRYKKVPKSEYLKSTKLLKSNNKE